MPQRPETSPLRSIRTCGRRPRSSLIGTTPSAAASPLALLVGGGNPAHKNTWKWPNRDRSVSILKRSRLVAVGRYEVDRRLAEIAARRGDAISAMVRAGLAAAATSDRVERIEVLALAGRQAEVALHQAVYAANGGRPRLPWRQLAGPTGVPWETLYRRYHKRPKKMPRRQLRAAMRLPGCFECRRELSLLRTDLNR
jgi:hypothetical protein